MFGMMFRRQVQDTVSWVEMRVEVGSRLTNLDLDERVTERVSSFRMSECVRWIAPFVCITVRQERETQKDKAL